VQRGEIKSGLNHGGGFLFSYDVSGIPEGNQGSV
jgi:hypothetical protein